MHPLTSRPHLDSVGVFECGDEKVPAGSRLGLMLNAQYNGMKTILRALVALAFLAPVPATRARDVLSLDDDWRFFKGDVMDAEQPHFDDSQWQVVQLPHDWSMDAPSGETNSAGVAWYRKRFGLPSKAMDQRVSVEFDGISQKSDVWINGLHLGHQTNGALGFRYGLPATTLGFGNGANNVLAVCADTSAQPASPWHTGAGICRPVHLVITPPVHLVADAVSIAVSNLSGTEVVMQIETAVTNESSAPCQIGIQTSLWSPEGDNLGAVESSQTVAPGDDALVDEQFSVLAPRLWTLETPSRYCAVAKLRLGGHLIDEQTNFVVLRDVHFSSGTNFLLNGKPRELKAVRLFPDGGAFGAAVPISIWENRLRTLKSLGVNAVHTTADPITPKFIGVCDRLGLLLMDEFPDGVNAAKQVGEVGVDYLDGGEGRLAAGHNSALLDRTGAVRLGARLRQSLWASAPMVAIARYVSPTNASHFAAERLPALVADWTPPLLTPHPESIEVYSNCKEVELYLNGKSLGKKSHPGRGSPFNWQVSFAPGILKAVAREDGRRVATNELRTAGEPAQILLASDEKNFSPAGEAVATIRASIADANGIIVPAAADRITFKITGPAVIAAVDNADYAAPILFQTNSCPAFEGRCVAFVKAGGTAGKITLTATAAGLKPDSLTLSPGSAPGL